MSKYHTNGITNNTMEHTSDESNSSIGSFKDTNSPLNFSKTQCAMSTKASAFSIDALIGRKRSLVAQLQNNELTTSLQNSDDDEDRESDDQPSKRLCCDSPTEGSTHVNHSDTSVNTASIGAYIHVVNYKL